MAEATEGAAFWEHSCAFLEELVSCRSAKAAGGNYPNASHPSTLNPDLRRAGAGIHCAVTARRRSVRGGRGTLFCAGAEAIRSS